MRRLSLTPPIIAAALAACIAPELVPCGDQLCPAGSTCVAMELCATPTQITACSDRYDGDVCTLGGGIGVCDRVCVPTACGNGVVDADET